MKQENKITVAKTAGFCFGVGRASEAVEREIAQHIPGTRIFTLGRLIHNDTYVARLAAQGDAQLAGILTEEERVQALEETKEEGKDVVQASGSSISTSNTVATV